MRPLALDVTDPLTGSLIRKGLPLPYPPGVFADTPSPYATGSVLPLPLRRRWGHPPGVSRQPPARSLGWLARRSPAPALRPLARRLPRMPPALSPAPAPAVTRGTAELKSARDEGVSSPLAIKNSRPEFFCKRVFRLSPCPRMELKSRKTPVFSRP
jgi:hypothetical protein